MNTDTATRTRQQATDALDDLRETLVHSATCEDAGPHPVCETCELDHYISRVVRDLADGYPLAEVILTAKHIGQSLPYDLDRQVHHIVRTVAE